jgi:acetoin:2,6-dichlorophenolindophenol oxidoreductase subunit beta
MSVVTFRQAINTAISDAMDEDGDVILIGEDVAAAGGVFKVTEGLLDRFGPDRVRDTPISEQAIIGAAIGAAMMGLRPIAELMFADFAAVCFDQIANQLAKHRYLTGGQVGLPVTVRLVNGASLGFAAQHSQSVENWFLNIPGLRIAVPSTPSDAYSLLRIAIRDPNPVLVFEHKALLNFEEDWPNGFDHFDEGPLGKARVVRSGRDITLVATQLMRHRAVSAANELAANGIQAEVIDPRCLAPLDFETIERSVMSTGRLLVVQEAPRPGSWGATVVAKVAEDCFESLLTAPRLLASDETPVPYAANLENAWMPSIDSIQRAVAEVVHS